VNIEQFWKHIDESRAATDSGVEEQVEQLRSRLRTLPPEDVATFATHFDAVRARVNTWDLWAAAYLLLGGCSDDGFTDFRSWLIAQGRSAYEAAAADPDTLATLDVDVDELGEEVSEAEMLAYVADEVYQELTGEEEAPRDGDGEGTAEPAGEPWDEDDDEALRQRFPRLSALVPPQ
jgi:hypothetical protein